MWDFSWQILGGKKSSLLLEVEYDTLAQEAYVNGDIGAELTTDFLQEATT